MQQSRKIYSALARADLSELERYIDARDGELRAQAGVARIEMSLNIVALRLGIGPSRPVIAGVDTLFFPVRP